MRKSGVYPIPRKLLPHKATLRRKEGGDAWHEPEIIETPLTFVRFDGGSTMTYHLNGQDVNCAMTMFFDCVNSAPKDIEFQFGDEIEWDGNLYTVKAIDKKPTDSNNIPFHHYEIGLA